MEDKIEKMQDILTNEEIAIRLTEIWCESDCEYIDDILNAYDIVLNHLNNNEY